VGDLSLAEEMVQEAFAVATERWAKSGIPPAPDGWIITTARNKALDRFRRESTREGREASAQALLESQRAEGSGVEVRDDTLRLMFTCCHPAIAIEAQVALTLRLLGGLETREIARAFLLSESAMAQRLSRVKAKIRQAGIPYRIPDVDELPARVRSVLAVVYLIFNEGYSGTTSIEVVRTNLCDEAIRLGRLLLDLLPEDSEVAGLLALMLFIDARRCARSTSRGELITLKAQDRQRWDVTKIDEARQLLRECLSRDKPGPYQIQAAINAVHTDAPNVADTDWQQVIQLYDQLLALQPSAVVALNRAVAVAEVAGAGPALHVVESLAGLKDYHPFHAVRAHLLERLERNADAASAYLEAIQLCQNRRERDYLDMQYQRLRKH
jgi:RNA polymerase sigma-70 factor (ECF subfamily)